MLFRLSYRCQLMIFCSLLFARIFVLFYSRLFFFFQSTYFLYSLWIKVQLSRFSYCFNYSSVWCFCFIHIVLFKLFLFYIFFTFFPLPVQNSFFLMNFTDSLLCLLHVFCIHLPESVVICLRFFVISLFSSIAFIFFLPPYFTSLCNQWSAT